MTLVSFPRPAPEIRDLLRASLPTATIPATSISTKPIPGETGSRPAPWIQVSTDSRARDSRLDGTALVRLTVWAIDEGAAEDLAELAEATLLASLTSSPGIRSILPASGVFPTTDPDTGLGLASFSVEVHLRPRPTL